jgi:hypothetical protein
LIFASRAQLVIGPYHMPGHLFCPSSSSDILATASYPVVVAPISSGAIDYHYLHFAFLSIIPTCRARTSPCFSRLYIPLPGRNTTIQICDSCTCERRPTSLGKISMRPAGPLIHRHLHPLLGSSDPWQITNMRPPNPYFNTDRSYTYTTYSSPTLDHGPSISLLLHFLITMRRISRHNFTICTSRRVLFFDSFPGLYVMG